MIHLKKLATVKQTRVVLNHILLETPTVLSKSGLLVKTPSCTLTWNLNWRSFTRRKKRERPRRYRWALQWERGIVVNLDDLPRRPYVTMVRCFPPFRSTSCRTVFMVRP